MWCIQNYMLCPPCITKWACDLKWVYLSINTTFDYQAHPAATRYQHFIDKVCKTLAFINPRQTPATVTADQPCTLTQRKFNGEGHTMERTSVWSSLDAFRLLDTHRLDSCNNKCRGDIIWYNTDVCLHLECYQDVTDRVHIAWTRTGRHSILKRCNMHVRVM